MSFGIADDRRLVISCLEWFQVEMERVRHGATTMDGASWLARHLIPPEKSWDTTCAHEALDEAITSAKNDDIEATVRALRSAHDACVDDLQYMGFGGKELLAFLERCPDVLAKTDVLERREALESLWFDIGHAWRSKRSMGVPLVMEQSKFMLVEWIATIFLIYIGLVLPTLESTGIFKLVPVVYMTLMTAAVGSALSIRHGNLKFLLLLAVGGIGYLPLLYLPNHMSRWVLWTYGGSALIGYFIGDDVSYRRSRRMATQYGPFAQLWARHVDGHVFELMMITGEGDLAWYYQVSNWWRQADPCVGSDLSTDLRGDLRNKCWKSKPHGGWLVCYPALAATRMEGLRRRNPVDWAEAEASTPDLTPEMINEFFANPPSLVEPPAEFVASGPTVLPHRENIPGWGDRNTTAPEERPAA